MIRQFGSRSVLGAIALGGAIAASSLVIVRAEHAPPPKKGNSFTCSSGTACLMAKSTGSSTYAFSATSTAGQSNAAVEGLAAGTGVFGSGGSAGVTGYSAGDFGVEGFTGTYGENGVYGDSDAYGSAWANAAIYGLQTSGSPGVFGTSVQGPGVFGEGGNYLNSYGVEGLSNSTAGVYGYSTGPGYYGVYGEDDAAGTPAGVYGYSSTGVGTLGFSESSNSFAIGGIANGATTGLFDAFNIETGGACEMDNEGNLSCTGKVTGVQIAARHRNSNGQKVLAYASESASETIEDVGEGRLFNGVANVMLPADLASVIDARRNYYVFLTPLGDTRGIYVSMKTTSGFQVRENMRGRSDVAFDYRIVAKPMDASDDRLPLAPRIKRLHVPPHPPTAHVNAPSRPPRLALPAAMKQVR